MRDNEIRSSASVKPGPRDEGRKTEDEMAREKLGGVKGSLELPPAPLTPKEKEQNYPNDDGHVA